MLSFRLVMIQSDPAGGRSFRTTGKITAVVGTPPQRVGLSEWDNVEQAQAWNTSQARKDLNAERDKAIKIIRQYRRSRNVVLRRRSADAAAAAPAPAWNWLAWADGP